MRKVTMAKGSTLSCALAIAFTVGCSSGGGDGRAGSGNQFAGGTGGGFGGSGGAAGLGGQGGQGGQGGVGGTGGTGGVAGQGGQGGTGGNANNEWCAVEALMQERCTECHAENEENLDFGAPMGLATHAQLTAPSPNDPNRPTYEVAMARMTGEETPRMPTGSNPPMTDAELATFQAWIDAGTPNATSCDAGTGGTGGMGGTGGTGGDPDVKHPYSCDEGTPMKFLAHNNPEPGDTTPFDASHIGGPETENDPNLYQCFYFKAPWEAGQQGLGFKPIIDNSRVLHHWLLYASDNAPADVTDGGMKGHCQLQGDENRVLLAGWAPGTPGQSMPPNVGMKLPSGDRGFLTLEIHYYNTNPGEPADDRSGVELCLADEQREHTANQHWLGTENINVDPNSTGMASDTCTPNLAEGETSTLISVTPHMHKIGTHAKLEILRQDGTTQVIHDKAFEFENQMTYTFDEQYKIHAGDQLRATCEFKNTSSNTVTFGEGSDEEMCYLFTTAYPAGSLHNGRNGCFFEFCVPGGVHRCIDDENIIHAVNAG